MLYNYFKIGVRNLLRNKLFSSINIFGMAVSMASVILIVLYVFDEMQFDKDVADVDSKYRVYTEYFSHNGDMRKMAMIPPIVAPAMAAEFPEVVSFARFMNINSSVLFKSGDKKFTEAEGGYADPEILDMLSVNVKEGMAKLALREVDRIAISQTLAKKYFGDKSAVGQQIDIENETFTVDAVFEDFSDHSHFKKDYFLSMASLSRDIPERMKNWGWSQFHTYVKLVPGSDALVLDKKLLGFAEKNAWPSTKERGSYYVPHLMPLRDIHLYASDHTYDIAQRGNSQTVYILSGTALFILIIAILNFVNLSTARAITRVKEVGVRKVVGAVRTQLIYQFISESAIISFVALLFAVGMAQLVLPWLNTFTGKVIPESVLLDPVVAAGMLGMTLIIGLAAGSYPAFYLSGFRPSQILSNKQSGGGKNFLRKALVTVQFVLSFMLVTAVLVVSGQHQFLRTADMGFNKENLIVLPLHGSMQQNAQAVKNAFSNHPNVLRATLEYGLPGEAYAGDGIRDEATKKDWPISLLMVDHDYLTTMSLTLIAGRDFSKDRPSDEWDAFIISESAAKMLGYQNPEDALQHRVSWERWDDPEKRKEGTVIGIIKDFHLNSLKENMTPIALQIYPQAYQSIALKISDQDLPATLEHLRKAWSQLNPDWPFEYRFIDDNFDKLYKSEEKLSVLFTCFSILTVLVAALGLFGLVVYSTTQRYKEISIRKVLGAREVSIFLHLGRNYLFIMAAAFIIAFPLTYYGIQSWLMKFPFRIEVGPWLFIKAALYVLVLALVTVGIQ